MNNFIWFDLEGPLSPQDNAYELMKLFPSGNKIFEIISRYDELADPRQKEVRLVRDSYSQGSNLPSQL